MDQHKDSGTAARSTRPVAPLLSCSNEPQTWGGRYWVEITLGLLAVFVLGSALLGFIT
jgi:hypothetical protein